MDDVKTLLRSSLFQFSSSLSHFMSILSRYRRLIMKLSSKVFFLLAFILPAVQAQAQGFPWGMGMYGAVQSCPGGVQGSRALKDALKDYKQRDQDLKKLQTEIKKLEKDKRTAEAEKRKAKASLGMIFKSEWFETMTNHMDNTRACASYYPTRWCAEKSKYTEEGKKYEGPDAKCNINITKARQNDWEKICNVDEKGGIDAQTACNDDVYKTRYADKAP